MDAHRRRWVSALLCAPWWAPSSRADTLGDADFQRPPAGSMVLSLHLPATEPAYRAADDEARQRVESTLARAGYRVARVDPQDYFAGLKTRLRDPQLAGSGVSDLNVLLARVEAEVLSTVARVACDAMASPLLVRTRFRHRVATLERGVARWDGVRREVSTEIGDAARFSVNQHGTAPGISLEAIGVRADGRIVMQRHGGIALPYRMRVGTDGSITTEALANPFADPAWLPEGIALALDALLPR